jgi:peptide/nickel transport system substrate-binding protein
MQQRAHQLDIVNNITAEGMITLARTSPTSRGWFPGFPWGHPDPTLPSIIFNLERKGLNNRDIRWALTLSIDMVRVAVASCRGATTISAIHVPPTSMERKYYSEPLEGWLKDFTLDLGGGATIKPYDPDMAVKIAAEARKTLNELVPTNPAEIRKAIGDGWWKYDTASAEKLMLKAGMKRGANNMWVFPDGSPFKISVLTEGESRPTVNRAAMMIVENWRDFGVDAVLDARDAASRGRLAMLGDYDVEAGWNVETWGGHPDLFFFLESWHSKFYRPSGENAVGRNRMRWRNPQLDRIIDAIQGMDFDDPKVIQLGQDYVKLAVQEMPMIPLMSNTMFTVLDNYYWPGFPNSDNPFATIVPSWSNNRYMFVRLKKK